MGSMVIIVPTVQVIAQMALAVGTTVMEVHRHLMVLVAIAIVAVTLQAQMALAVGTTVMEVHRHLMVLVGGIIAMDLIVPLTGLVDLIVID